MMSSEVVSRPWSAERLRSAYAVARQQLLAARTAEGHWIGELSTSALSTATAISALSLMGRATGTSYESLVERGLAWLSTHQNSDGGWGDTDRSHSNIATTMLVRAAFSLAAATDRDPAALQRAAAYIERQGEIDGLRRRYGVDKTFAVPILTNAALAGLVPWKAVAPLPFELAWLPHRWYRLARMPVVSYAIPALVAIGQARFHHAPPWFAPLRWLRARAVGPTLRVLERMQPRSGGYLEAVPLTSFVVMSLAACGRASHQVARRGAAFLEESVRPDGSWPIDTNLATWNTTLALNALAAGGDDLPAVCGPSSDDSTATAPTDCLGWLLSCQQREVHPFTQAEPGGWGWSDLSGAVPDADDTPGALLALAAWRRSPSCSLTDVRRIDQSIAPALDWLFQLQNRDGGWPTFCRGWGRLPFDRSGADLTAHVLRALAAWGGTDAARTRHPAIQRAVQAGFEYLGRAQARDGSWLPLWFGNQDQPREQNPVYGTAKVLMAYHAWGHSAAAEAQRAVAWLAAARTRGAGWGSVEETALACESFATLAPEALAADGREALAEGLDALICSVETSRHLRSAPIGLYFAKLWYYERLYPLIFTVAALGRANRLDYPASRKHP